MRLYEALKNDQVYVIAEMSANHAGKLENALEIVRKAKQAGADGAYIGTILMKQWDDEPKLWAMLDDFESVSEP